MGKGGWDMVRGSELAARLKSHGTRNARAKLVETDEVLIAE
jgi:hypothetical protein